MTLAFDAPRIQEVVGALSRKMLINGEWVDAASGRTFDSLNPATEEVLASVAHGQAEDTDRAVRAARGHALSSWHALAGSGKPRCCPAGS